LHVHVVCSRSTHERGRRGARLSSEFQKQQWEKKRSVTLTRNYWLGRQYPTATRQAFLLQYSSVTIQQTPTARLDSHGLIRQQRHFGHPYGFTRANVWLALSPLFFREQLSSLRTNKATDCFTVTWMARVHS